MTFLPIVDRELRVASRRRATYWSRCITAMAAIIVGLVVYISSYQRPPHELGQALFEVISILAYIYCLLTGVRSTADCLSEEKREGTLGLLFLTDLKGYDVVGGKLVATSLNAFYGLMAIFPVLAIPLLMGGITNGEFWRMALVLANTFLFSLAMGMLISSFSKYPRKAMAGTFLLLLTFCVLLPIGQAWSTYIQRSPRLNTICDLLDPSYSVHLVSDANYVKSMNLFWWSVGIIHGLCWLFLVLASVIVPRSWQDNPPGAKSPAGANAGIGGAMAILPSAMAFRKRLLDINAFFWLAGRARLKPLHVWVAFSIVAFFWAWGALAFRSDWFNPGVYIVTAMILNTMLKLWIASEAGRRLGEDRKIGALELLLSTPLSVGDILRGQMLALRRQFFGPLIAACVIESIFLVASLHGNQADIGDFVSAYVMCWVAGLIMLVADIAALSLVGMWVSLTAKNPNRATGITVRRVLILPLAVGLAILIFMAIFQVGEGGWKIILGLWFGLGILADVVFGWSAWWRLQNEFREAAVHRVVPGPSLLKRLLVGNSQEARNPAAEICSSGKMSPDGGSVNIDKLGGECHFKPPVRCYTKSAAKGGRG